MKDKITISLISHTNIGKTTLARTLLKEDIGTVRDSAHTTLDSQEKILIENNRAQLILWDTPGFGGVNAAHIEERIRAAGTAKGWLKSQVIDRIANRSLYSSVEAAKNIRLKADIVLYLVDNRCSPGEAGYLKGELALLQTLKRPVIVLINHLDSQGEEIQKDVLKTWEASCGDYDVVKGIVVLDAFSRIWLQELSLLEEINNALPEEQRASMTSLNAEYKEQQERIESACMMEIAGLIDFARSQKVDLKDGPDKKEIFRRLFIPLDGRFQEVISKMVLLYHLDAEESPELKADISMLSAKIKQKIPEKTAGLISGAVAGAGGGLAADLLSGGLTFGGGALVGFVLGGLTGVATAKGINAFIRNDGEGRWSNEYFLNLLQQSLIFYLLIAHHGRGKGLVNLGVEVNNWSTIVKSSIDEHKQELETAQAAGISEKSDEIIAKIKTRIFGELYNS